MASYLLDTNILLRVVQPAAPEYPTIEAALSALTARGDDLFLTPQVLIEFWGAVTRPTTVNGFGWSPDAAHAEVARLRALFPLLPERTELFEQWLSLVQEYRVSGKQVHDARLVAAMLGHGLSHLLTLNVADFTRFQEITVVHPQAVQGGDAQGEGG